MMSTDPAISGMRAQVDIVDSAFVVDAALLGELLDVPVEQMRSLMSERAITTLCEAGVGADLGAFRLSFFYRNRRARLQVDAEGRILRRSVVDFGDRPMPPLMRRPGA